MRTALWFGGSAVAHAALVAALVVRWPEWRRPPPEPPPNAVEVVLVQQAAEQPGDPAPAAEPPPPPDGEAPPLPPPSPPPPEAPAVRLGAEASAPWNVTSDDIRPPAPDARYRNLPPRFPVDAAARGETGAVAMLVHVAEDGTAAGADIVTTSGSPRLDREARRALLLWHFEPARLDGRAVPFDYPITISFTRDH